MHRFPGASSLAVACLLFLSAGAALRADELFVTNIGNESITVYSRAASGNVVPLRTISGASTGLGNPFGIVVDTVHDEIIVANAVGSSITVYSRNANGNVAPLRTISGSNTLLVGPRGLALDPVHDEIIVSSPGNNMVLAFRRTDDGNVAPLRKIRGHVNTPAGLTLDLVHDEILIVNRFFSTFPVFNVIVHPRTAAETALPVRTIEGPNSGTYAPYDVQVDTVHDEIFVTNGISPNPVSVTVHTRTANGDVAPLRTISGANTQLGSPEGVFVDLVNNEVAVTNASGVRVYPRTANGDVAPIRILQGILTQLSPGFLTETVASVVGTSFFSVAPCRVVDTRNPNGPYGGPALAANTDRTFVFDGQCGVPSGASAVALNVAVTLPTAGGDLRLFPGGSSPPLVSAINYNAGKTRANNAVIPLGASGDLAVHVDQPNGTVHAILDVTGYFQ